jgi:hypothetical protein
MIWYCQNGRFQGNGFIMPWICEISRFDDNGFIMISYCDQWALLGQWFYNAKAL